MKSFNEIYENSLTYSRSFHMLVYCATECNHIDLLELLVRNRRCGLEILDSLGDGYIPRPLFVAMRVENYKAMHILLLAGSSLYTVCSILESFEDEHYCDTPHTFMSAIEYAYVLDKPDMLKLLLSYDTQRRLSYDSEKRYLKRSEWVHLFIYL